MAIVNNRSRVLFLPLVRSFFNKELGTRAKRHILDAAAELGIDGIFPPDDKYTDGSICSDADVRGYFEEWRGEMSNIKALVAFGGNFMEERAFQDTLRLLPVDVPVFLAFQNDNPSNMQFDNRGDALCGSLSIHRNARMLGREITATRGIDFAIRNVLIESLRTFKRIMDGIECMRNMRVALVGVNPVEFATTFVNQMELFRCGFSLHTYELIDLWGATVLAGKQEQFKDQMDEIFPGLTPDNPIYSDDPRVEETKTKLSELIENSHIPQDKVDLVVRCFLWIRDIFERDQIDAGGIHCWTSFERYFQIVPCTFAALANSMLEKPLVCETDVCHAIMTKLAHAMTGDPGVILDVNNPGWDPRVFNVFHCSQTPPEWIEGRARMSNQMIIEGDDAVGEGNAFGTVEGDMIATPFTGISAATTSDAFHATVFQGQLLREHSVSFGGNGWAFVPNLQEVLDEVHQHGIHHFVMMKGHIGSDVARALQFRGLSISDRTTTVPSLERIEEELGPVPEGGRPVCGVHSH